MGYGDAWVTEMPGLYRDAWGVGQNLEVSLKRECATRLSTSIVFIFRKYCSLFIMDLVGFES